MRAIPKHEMTADEFAAWAVRMPKEAGRYELIDGVVVTLQAERVGHARVKAKLAQVLAAAALHAGLPCETPVDGPLIRISPKNSFRPDGLLHCGPPLPDDIIEVPDPILVYEVLSPDSGSRDHGENVDGYFSRPGIQHYLIVDPVRRAIIHHRRGNGTETIRHVVHAGDVQLDPPGLSFSMADVF